MVIWKPANIMVMTSASGEHAKLVGPGLSRLDTRRSDSLEHEV